MLDTNIVIFTMKNRPQRVRETFRQHSGDLCISSVSHMELVYGAEKSDRPERNLDVLKGFVARLEIVPYDEKAAAHSGQIRSDLAKAGTPIGPYDQMIAGHARSLGLMLVSNNTKEFSRVAGLRLVDWS